MQTLTNVARHSESPSAAVTLTLARGSALTGEVSDLGDGGAPWRPGVGVILMTERATELGGILAAGPGPRRDGLRGPALDTDAG
jgi:signal transduction histidine kinase